MAQRCCYYVCESFLVKGRGYRASIVFEGEKGHRPTGTWPYNGRVGEVMPYFWGPTLEDAQAQAEHYNARMGVTPDAAREIVLSSMV